MYDWWSGGKDNLAIDREIAARVAQVAPVVVSGVRANRAFVRRATAFLAESGIGQYIDLGSGLPTGQNVHEIAGCINPDARVAYVDFDPIVLVHARTLLANSTFGRWSGHLGAVVGRRSARRWVAFAFPASLAGRAR
jgi:hypothetical protein